jgi:Protein of unknown function (DUF4238)
MCAQTMTVRQKPKRDHHHVWQLYLKQWTTHGAIWCLQKGRIFSTGTPVLAVQRDFYKLHNLTGEDIALIKLLFANGHPLSKRNHARLLNMLIAPFRLAEQVKHPQDRVAMDRFLDDHASNVLEEYHAGIEASFIPLLECALNRDISFYNDERCIPFLYYLCTQYMRTKGIKERSIERCNADKSADLSRVWNVLIHMFAENISAGLFQERKRRKLVLVHSRTNMPFITGDQPAINLKASGPHSPESLSIYYPISPKLALLLGDVDKEPMFGAEGITAAQVSTLNEKLFEASYQQVFAQSEQALKALRRG